MIAVDTNILVAFHRLEYPHHGQAADCLRTLAESPATWCMPWPCVHEFTAVVTNGRIFKNPTPVHEALDVMTALMESPSLRMLSESAGYWQVFAELTAQSKVTGGRVHDARIAALCLHHRVSELWTADRDFSRFPALKCRNPLI